MAPLPVSFFRPGAMVYLVTHPASTELSPAWETGLLGWTKDQALKLIPQANDRLKFADKAASFSFPAPPANKGAESKTPSGGSDLAEDIQELAADLRRGDFAAAAKVIIEELHPDSAAHENRVGTSVAARSAPILPPVAAPVSFTVLFPTVGDITPAETVVLAKGLETARAEFNKANSEKGFTLAQVALNWYVPGGHDGCGSGGPGGPPTAVTGSRSTSHPFEAPDLAGEFQRSVKEGAAMVHVAILDTSPAQLDLDNAFTNLGGQHPIIGTLLGPGGRLVVELRDQLSYLNDIHIDGHDYVMSDHGLFVAGIIHTIAPGASLHLFEVLNKYGVGDELSIAGGLSRIAALIAAEASAGKAAQWVVNASLMLGAPGEELHWERLLELLADQPKDLGDKDRHEHAELLALFKSDASVKQWLLTGQSDAVVYMCNHLRVYWNVPVIAAAGNDRQGLGGHKPGARYPARAASVLGVGALTSAFLEASYSNKADEPLAAGIVTFGGDRSTPAAEVLGVYIGSDFNGVPSKDGWASWSGTSFATPIVSGLTAKLLATGRFATTKDAIGQIFAVIGPTGRKVGGSDLLRVTQA